MKSLRRALAAALLASLVASTGGAETVATKERARLRQGPSAATELLGELDANTKVELLGESGGWRQVRISDGRVGYVWGDHLASHESAPTPASESKPAAPPAATRTLADDIRDLHEEVNALRQRPEPATAADLERLREALEHVAAAERELARRLDPPVHPFVDPPPDSAAAVAPAFLFGGAVLGFAASRLLQRRRDRRQRNRLHL